MCVYLVCCTEADFEGKSVDLPDTSDDENEDDDGEGSVRAVPTCTLSLYCSVLMLILLHVIRSVMTTTAIQMAKSSLGT